MEFFFWQNIISIHKSAFISNLSKNYQVTLIVEKQIESYRINDGWVIPEMGRASVIEAPSHEQICEIMNKSSNAIHIFSGIATYTLTTYALKILIKKGRCSKFNLFISHF